MRRPDRSHDQPELEAELRAMLHRRARDVHPDPPDWRDLLSRSDAVVVSLHGGRRVDPGAGGAEAGRARRRRARDWSWLPAALAAAACLAVVMAAGVVIGRTTGPGGGSGGSASPGADARAATDSAAQDPSQPAAGERGFSAATASPLIPGTPDAPELEARLAASGSLPQDLTWMEQPERAGLWYLRTAGLTADVGIDELVADASATGGTVAAAEPGLAVWTDPAQPMLEQPGVADSSVETATMWWSVRQTDGALNRIDPPIVVMGRLFLRNLTPPSDAARPDAWTVVGAKTQGLDLANVSRDGDQLGFTVIAYQSASADVDPTRLPVEVLVNDEVVNDDPLAPGEPTELTAEVPADQPARVTVRQIGEEAPLSVTETMFLPQTYESSPPTTVREVAPTVTPAGRATVVIGGDCDPDADVMVAMDLPHGFSTEPTGTEETGTEVVPPDSVEIPASLACTFRFDEGETASSGSFTIGWGPPPFEMPPQMNGPACFRWAALDDGGFVAARMLPHEIYVLGSGLTEDEFATSIETVVVSGAETWTADEGC